MPPLALILLLLLVALPLLEIAILIKVGSLIGVAGTIAIIVATALAGIAIVRLQGLGVARRGLAAIRAGEPPVEHMLDGMLLMFAGGCLIAPGLLTDVIGAILLVPPLRFLVAQLIVRRGVVGVVRTTGFRRSKAAPAQDRRPAHGPAPTIEGDYERIDERTIKPSQKPPPNPPK
jgi:UPF0716 protein FxsA